MIFVFRRNKTSKTDGDDHLRYMGLHCLNFDNRNSTDGSSKLSIFRKL